MLNDEMERHAICEDRVMVLLAALGRSSVDLVPTLCSGHVLNRQTLRDQLVLDNHRCQTWLTW